MPWCEPEYAARRETTRTPVNMTCGTTGTSLLSGAVIYFATDSLLHAGLLRRYHHLYRYSYQSHRTSQRRNSGDSTRIWLNLYPSQPFCAGFIPFAWAINKGLDKIPGVSDIEIDAEGMEEEIRPSRRTPFPRFYRWRGYRLPHLQVSCEIIDKSPYVLGLGIKMGAVMELIQPRDRTLASRVFSLFQMQLVSLIARKFKGTDGLNINIRTALISANYQCGWYRSFSYRHPRPGRTAAR